MNPNQIVRIHRTDETSGISPNGFGLPKLASVCKPRRDRIMMLLCQKMSDPESARGLLTARPHHEAPKPCNIEL